MYSTELSFITNATLQECYILQFCIIQHFQTTAINKCKYIILFNMQIPLTFPQTVYSRNTYEFASQKE